MYKLFLLSIILIAWFVKSLSYSSNPKPNQQNKYMVVFYLDKINQDSNLVWYPDSDGTLYNYPPPIKDSIK